MGYLRLPPCALAREGAVDRVHTALKTQVTGMKKETDLGDGEHVSTDDDVVSHGRDLPGLAAKIARQSTKLFQVVLVHLTFNLRPRSNTKYQTVHNNSSNGSASLLKRQVVIGGDRQQHNE